VGLVGGARWTNVGEGCLVNYTALDYAIHVQIIIFLVLTVITLVHE
jgi:hypothetical protein